MIKVIGVSALLLLLAACQSTVSTQADKPLYRDPIYDGAADPTVVWDPSKQRWLMFYTNRRANQTGLDGVTWVHGTPIGIASSIDGQQWQYLQDANIDAPPGSDTLWAPDVFIEGNTAHMFLTIVPGVFENWGHPRQIMHFTSENMLDWQYQSTLNLNSNRVIDADVVALPQGGYRLFYNDEPDGKSIYYADSDDLYHWQDKGKAALESRGEGPVVFYWQQHWWMVVDAWQGLAVYRSHNLNSWQKQPYFLLAEPGSGTDDGVIGQHPDVVTHGGRALLFYFTHPGRTAENAQRDDTETRRSSIQVVELGFNGAWLTAERDTPIEPPLFPPDAK